MISLVLVHYSPLPSPPLPSPPCAVGGLGFGAIAGVVAFSNVLRESGGPGIVGVEDGGSQFFILSSGEKTNGCLVQEHNFTFMLIGVLFLATTNWLHKLIIKCREPRSA